MQVSGLAGVQRIAAGEYHSLAATEGGSLVTFGDNTSGQLGLGEGQEQQSRGESLTFRNSLAIAAGHDHTLAVASTGIVYAWGGNAAGQLGNGEAANSTGPILVTLPWYSSRSRN
ncbi:hypothetical protein D7V80_02310 [Corallococcus sp. CA054B]|nr:hypothetical protein D7V80_02310 [Corallococcus sp. CA054B]